MLRKKTILRLLSCWGFTLIGFGIWAQDPECLPPVSGLLVTSCDARASLLLSPFDQAFAREGVYVTGTYSSQDRFGIESLAFHEGRLVSSRLKNWDGVVVIDQGRLGLWGSRDILFQDVHYDLRDARSRALLHQALKENKASFLQGHMLITNAQVDVRPAGDLRRFVRRALIQSENGAIGVYQTHPRRLTLYEFALEIKAELHPKFALNLDMGTYDFCYWHTSDIKKSCGFLFPENTGRLTNILFFPSENAGK